MAILDIFKRNQPARRSRLFRMGSKRNFAGASTGRLLSGWTTTPRTPDEVLTADLRALRARSRDSFHNNDFVRRFVGLVKTNVVGPRGVTMQAQSIGRSGSLDRPANDAIEAAWADWCRAENCDYAQRLPFAEMQRQAIASAAIDGEILAVVHRIKKEPYLRIQHIDPEALDIDYTDKLGNGNSVRLGVERDTSGVIVAYHLMSSGTGAYQAKNGKHYVRIDASRIIHSFVPDQINQSRGYPWVAPALQRLKMLDGYYEAAMTAARAGAAKMGFLVDQEGTEYTGDDKDADGATISDFEAGTIEQLPSGMSFQAFDPRYPHEQFASFVKSCLQAIGGSMGPGISYSSLSNDLEGVNYSSIRAGVLEEREGWKILQEWFIESYLRPIFDAWLDVSMIFGTITVFGQPLSGDKSKYRRVSWQPRRWAWVDPLKDMNANILAITNNLTTASAVIREQGKDPDEVFMERAAEKARLKELGLTESEVINNV